MRLLLVEDESKTADYLLRGLREEGYFVDWAEDGEAGLGMALAGRYDLLILDVTMPGTRRMVGDQGGARRGTG